MEFLNKVDFFMDELQTLLFSISMYNQKMNKENSV